jgi:hypothetical protein
LTRNLPNPEAEKITKYENLALQIKISGSSTTGLARTSDFCRSAETAAAAAGMKRSVLNGSERTDGCFTTAFFKTQHASFSVRCGGRKAVGGGSGTKRT